MNDDDPLRRGSDATLVARAADGDVLAFEVLARRHGALMRVYAEQVLGSTIESDDVVQEAFLTGWRKLSDLEDPARFRSWMLQITTRKALDRLRRRRHHDELGDVEAPSDAARSPERIVENRLQFDALLTALDRLPADQRRCWLLRETAGYSYQQIADELELSTSTVRGLSHEHDGSSLPRWRDGDDRPRPPEARRRPPAPRRRPRRAHHRGARRLPRPRPRTP